MCSLSSIRRWLCAICAALVFLLACGGRVHAAEAYYLLLFGSQRMPNDPNYSHTSATVVRAVWVGPGAPRLEVHTISWLPRTLHIRVGALAPEDGVNLGLHETLRYAYANGERVSLWGPFQIDRELYLRALLHIRRLESGQVLYKAVDSGYSSDRVSSCIHAVSTIAEGPRLHVASPSWGETASYFILGQLRPWIIAPGTVHTWVSGALGLGSYPIIYRDPTTPPRSGVILGPFNRVLGGERQVQASYGPPW